MKNVLILSGVCLVLVAVAVIVPIVVTSGKDGGDDSVAQIPPIETTTDTVDNLGVHLHGVEPMDTEGEKMFGGEIEKRVEDFWDSNLSDRGVFDVTAKVTVTSQDPPFSGTLRRERRRMANTAVFVTYKQTTTYKTTSIEDVTPSDFAIRPFETPASREALVEGLKAADPSRFGSLTSDVVVLSWLQVGSDIGGPGATNWLGFSVTFSDDGSRFAAGAQYYDSNGMSNRGLVRVYEDRGGRWIQIGSDLIGDAAGNRFGFSLSISGDGNRVAVGAAYYDDEVKGSSHGQTKVFEYNESGKWVMVGSPIIGEGVGDQSGRSVSLSRNGSILAIGADENNGTNGSASGHVRVLLYSSGSWIQLGEDIDGEAFRDRSGWSVSLSDTGLVVAIGARKNDGVNGADSSHVRVFEYESSKWIQRGQDLDGEAAFDQYGYSVSLSSDGNIVAVGSIYNDGVGEKSGHVQVHEYDLTMGKWSQLGGDIDGEAADDFSGRSVSLSLDGTILAVGAAGNDGNGRDSGHVRIYKFDGSAWVRVGGDIDGESQDDWSGWSVSLSENGRRVAIGAPLNDDRYVNSGHVRVYELHGGSSDPSS